MSRSTLVIRLRRTPDSLAADISADTGASLPVHCTFPLLLDHTLLRSQLLNPHIYGLHLTEQLFRNPEARRCWDAVMQARGNESACVRLVLPASDPELHSIRWELLQVPQPEDATSSVGDFEYHLGLRTDVVIVRTVESAASTREPQVAQHADLRALVVIASPTGLEKYNLWPIDVEDWAAQARALLVDCALTIIGPTTGNRRPTFSTISALLHEGYDILYFICHGAVLKGESYLWLEGADGKVARVVGAQLVSAIAGVKKPPRLVVLATCQSAGSGQVEAAPAAEGGPRPDSASLAYQLGQHGIAATIAMQGLLRFESAQAFFSTFFTDLFHHREVARAVSKGRGVISRADWWVPTLFLQQQEPLLWLPPSDEDVALDWPVLDRLVGRAEERDKVMAALGRGEMVIVTGEEGIGKRTLLTHVARRLSEEGPRHLFWLSGEQGADLRALMERLVTFVGRKTGQAFAASLQTARTSPLSALDWVADGLRTLQPLLVLSEVDALWKDEGFQPLLDRLVPLIRDKTVALLLSTGHIPDVGRQSSRFLLRLGELSSSDVLAIIAANKWPLPESVSRESERLQAASCGNPLQLQLLVSWLASVADPLATLIDFATFHGTAEELVGSLIQTLPPDAPAILAALGVLADSPATREAVDVTVGKSGGGDAQLTDTLKELCAMGIVRRIGDTQAPAVYRLRRFRHARGLVSERDIVAMHRRAAAMFTAQETYFAALHLLGSEEPTLAAQTIISNVLTIVASGHLKRADKLLDQLPLQALEPTLAAEVKLAQTELRLLAIEERPAHAAAAEAEKFANQLGEPAARTSINARAARVRAAIYIQQGEFALAAGCCRPYLATPYLEQLPPELRCLLYAELADALYHEDKLKKARAAIKAGLREFEQAGNAPLQIKARLLMRRSTVASNKRNAQAIAWLQQARDLAKVAGDRALLARIHYNLGLELDQRGDSVSALVELEASRKLAHQIGSTEVYTYSLLAIGQYFTQREEYKTALAYLTDARDRLLALKLIPGYVHTLIEIGVLYFYWKRYDDALLQFLEAAAYNRKRARLGSELRLQTAIAEHWRGEVALVQGRASDALLHAERALQRFQKLQAVDYEAMAHRLRGDSLLALGEIRRAAGALRKAQQCDEEAQDPFDYMTLLVSNARLAAAQGKLRDACGLLKEAQECLTATPSPYHEHLIETAIRQFCTPPSDSPV